MTLDFIINTPFGVKTETFSADSVEACWDAFEATWPTIKALYGAGSVSLSYTKQHGFVEPLVVLG